MAWARPAAGRLAAEALAVLRAVLADLRAWGRFPVVTTRDRRLHGTPLTAERVVDLDAEVYPTRVVELARECGAALVVAPEGGGALEQLSPLVSDAGVSLLGSLPEAVAVAADKWECYRRFSQAGLPTPRTTRVPPGAAPAAAARLGYPVVVKPLDGAGCDGVGLATDDRVLKRALGQPALRGAESILVQKYASGSAASVSLLVAEGRSTVLSLNEQRVRAGIPFAYNGGVASWPHPRRAEACELAQRAVAWCPACGDMWGSTWCSARRLLADRDQSAADHVIRGAAPRRRPQHGRGDLARLSGRLVCLPRWPFRPSRPSERGGSDDS